MSEDPRRDARAPVLQMVLVGAIVSALGIAAGIAIDWFPEQGSTQALTVDTVWDVLIVVSVPIFVLVMTIVGFSMLRFRMRPGEEGLDGPPIHGNTRLEVIWTAVPAIILVALCSYAYVELRKLEKPQPGEMRINVTGQQFAWTFQYPQPGGKPVSTTQLYLPINKPVHFFVKSPDVLHDFWVPAFRMKVDAVPGIQTSYRITPRRLGSYPIVCAELCGLGHSLMRNRAHVVSASQFASWIAGKKAPVKTAAGPRPDARTIFANLMPKDFGDTLSAQELDALVTYLQKVAAT